MSRTHNQNGTKTGRTLLRFEVTNAEADTVRALADKSDTTIGRWMARIIRKEIKRRHAKGTAC